MTTVSTMVRVPSLMALTPGRTLHRKLAAKLMPTNAATTRFCRAGGIMIAKNIPYSATLSALTMRSGSALPARMPSAVPPAHAGAASKMAHDHAAFQHPGH